MPVIVVVALALLWAALALICYKRPDPRYPYRQQDLLAIGGYGLLVVAFFWQVLSLPNAWLPSGGGDLASFLYPVYSFAASNIQNGVLPLWNPHLYGGSPFAADMQTGLFYPINLLAFFVARPFTYQSMEGLAIIHYFLAGCFTYLYARGLGLRPLPSFFAGIVFAFSGFTVAHLGHLNMLAVASWLPLILFFFHRALTRGNLTSAVIAGAVFGVSALAGHVQMTLYIGLFLLVYWLWWMYRCWSGAIDSDSTSDRDHVGTGAPTGGRNLVALVTLPVTAILAVCLAAVQLIPSYELTRLSLRADISFAAAGDFKSTPLNLITLIVPHTFGSNAADAWGTFWGLTETYAYVGILTLALAALAIIFPRRTTPWWAFFLLTTVLFLLLSFGEQTPLYGWVYKVIPGFDKVRAPGRFALMLDFSLAVLAGIGLDTISGKLPALWRRVYSRFTLVVGGFLLAGIFLVAPYFYHALFTSQDKDPVIFNRLQGTVDSLNLTLLLMAISFLLLVAIRYRPGRRQFIGGLMVIVIVIDLFAANRGLVIGDQDVTAGFSHPEIVSFLQSEATGYRIDTATDIGHIWQPNTALMHGIDDIMGIYNPMLLADYKHYWESLGTRSVPAYDLLGAKYIVANKDVTLDWNKFRPVVTDAPKLNVYENIQAVPRAIVVPSAEIVSRDQMLDRLKSMDFEPQQTLLLEEGTPIVYSASAAPTTGKVNSLTQVSPNQTDLEVQTDQPGYLLLNDVYYPGWQCTVDGQDTAILRANYQFRAVPLSPGTHRVSFTFAPRSLLLGGLASGLAVMFVLTVVAVTFWRSQSIRRQATEPDSAAVAGSVS